MPESMLVLPEKRAKTQVLKYFHIWSGNFFYREHDSKNLTALKSYG